jgi:hypothetical protein
VPRGQLVLSGEARMMHIAFRQHGNEALQQGF